MGMCMSLRRRLILVNVSMVLLPLIITAVSGVAFLYAYSRISGSKIGYDNVEQVARIRYEIAATAGSIWNERPDTLAKIEFAQYLSVKLEGVEARVILLREREPVYAGIDVDPIDIERILTMRSGGVLQDSIRIDGIGYLVSTYPFLQESRETGTIVILTPVGADASAAGTFLLFLIVVYMISFITTNIIHSGKLSRSIARPLERLRSAVGEISKGNLNYTVIEEGDVEIRQVLQALELLRVKLDEFVRTQIRYDDNRKMLISSISHDLKTPITSIKGYVEGILDGVAQTSEKKESYLRTVYAKAVLLDNMIDDLLFYSKLDLNQIPFHLEPTDITRYMQDCVDDSEPEMARSGIAMTLENRLMYPCMAMMDRERMRRVFLNLFDNARKYMDKDDGRIQVILRETPETVIVEVSDNGSGIPREDLPMVFDRFYRSDAARSTAQGSGLGLAIAREIVEGHGGRIWVVSQESVGTQFMIALSKHTTGGAAS
jgi:signal transduction histidine kinase